MQSALEALGSVGSGNVSVIGDYKNGYLITFQGTNLHGVDVPNISVPQGISGTTATVNNFLRAGGGQTASIYFINDLGGADVNQETYGVWYADPSTAKVVLNGCGHDRLRHAHRRRLEHGDQRRAARPGQRERPGQRRAYGHGQCHPVGHRRHADRQPAGQPEQRGPDPRRTP